MVPYEATMKSWLSGLKARRMAAILQSSLKMDVDWLGGEGVVDGVLKHGLGVSKHPVERMVHESTGRRLTRSPAQTGWKPG
jgi:hypothetical protein